MVKTISHACGFHVRVVEKVPLLRCLPMRCSDAKAHELQVKHRQYIELSAMIAVVMNSSSVFIYHHTIIICQHVTPVYADSRNTITNACLW